MVSYLKSNNPIDLDNFYISLKLKEIITANNLENFTQWFLYFMNVSKTYSIENINKYFSKLRYLIEDETNSNRFLKALHILSKSLKEISVNDSIERIERIKDQPNSSKINNELFSYTQEIKKSIDEVIKENTLKSIVFVTPELGRWSTVGGLGVMVDELSQGLVNEGRDVIMVAPYYDKNRKGESDYLKKDPAKFEYIGTFTIHLDDYYSFGIHYGEVNGVKIYFLHNALIFPYPYPDPSPEFTTKQIACFSKASLELLCFIKNTPDIILTNDWFTGLTAAYAKYGHFGEYFNNSKFFHICHNLEPTYEGRLYLGHGVRFYNNFYNYVLFRL